jgi:malate dehydrogenase (oxaloacetate-decarboxylating)(NADP+)
MRPVFEASRHSARRIVFAEGEDERVLRTAASMLEETDDKPILIGRPEVVDIRCRRLGLPIRPERDFELVNPESDARYRDYWGTYHGLLSRRGVTPEVARTTIRTNTTAIGAVMVHRGEADSLICGTYGQFLWHLNYIRMVLARDGFAPVGALSLMILDDGPLFIADTQVHHDPTPEQVVEAATAAVRHARRFGVQPKVALCSHSQFGNLDTPSGMKMRAAMNLLDGREPDFAYEGEMHVDAALDPEIRDRLLPGNRLDGPANILVFANTDAASGVRNILKMKARGLEVGPILMGLGNRAHVVTPSITARGLLNMSAIAGTPVSHYG